MFYTVKFNRIFLLCACVCFLAVGVWLLGQDPSRWEVFHRVLPTTAGLSEEVAATVNTPVDPSPQTMPKAQYVLERERNRARQWEFLQELLADPHLSAAQRQEIQKKLMELTERWSLEIELENTLALNGFQDAVVLLAEEGASVLVGTILTGEQAMLLGDLVARVSNLPKTSIVIMDGQ